MAWAAAGGNYSCKLEADITMPELKDGETSNWTPVDVGSRTTFDGNGHTITGLVVNSTNNVGFIKNNHGTVKNLTLKNASISGGNNTGVVVGENNGTISACHVTGGSAIKGRNNAGGVVGYNAGTILACHVAKECSVKGDTAGGIAGKNQNGGTVTGCYALCSLNGKENMSPLGGIIGRFYDGSLTACYYGNCNKGVGNGNDTTIKVDGTVGKTWNDAMKGMNEALTAAGYTDYHYEVNGDSQTEPLILVKKQ